MSSIGKSFTLFLILIMAFSCLSLLMVKPASGQTVAIPTFIIRTVSGSYVVPTTYSTNPYTGVKITNLGYTVDSFNITVNIQNQPSAQFYILQYKGHYASQWSAIGLMQYNVTAFASSGAQTTVTFWGNNTTPLGQSSANPLNLYYIYFPNINNSQKYMLTSIPLGGQLDFRLQAVNGTVGERVFGGWIVNGNLSAFSAIQTVTIPTFNSTSSSTSSTPVVPEFPALAILPLCLSMFFVVMIVRHRKIANLSK